MKRTIIATVLATVIASGSAGCMPSGDYRRVVQGQHH